MFSFFRKKQIQSQSLLHTEFVVIDTELTGLNEKEDSIVSIGAIAMKGKTIKLGEIFYRKINPYSILKEQSVVIHQLTPSELNSCPDIEKILREFMVFLKRRVLVGYFIMIDIVFLKRAFKKYLKINFSPEAVDTYLVFKWLVEKSMVSEKNKNTTSLQAIAQAFDITTENLHDALSDAFITAQIFQKQISILLNHNFSKTDFLLKIGNPHISGYMAFQQQKVYQF